MIGRAASFMGSLLANPGASWASSDALPDGDGTERGFASALAFWTAQDSPDFVGVGRPEEESSTGIFLAPPAASKTRPAVPTPADDDPSGITAPFEVQGLPFTVAAPPPAPLPGPGGPEEAGASTAPDAPPTSSASGLVDPTAMGSALLVTPLTEIVDLGEGPSDPPATRSQVAPTPIPTGGMPGQSDGGGDGGTNAAASGGLAREVPPVPGGLFPFLASSTGVPVTSDPPALFDGEPASAPQTAGRAPLNPRGAGAAIPSVVGSETAPASAPLPSPVTDPAKEGPSEAKPSAPSTGPAAPSNPVEGLLAARGATASGSNTMRGAFAVPGAGFAVESETVLVPNSPHRTQSPVVEWAVRRQRGGGTDGAAGPTKLGAFASTGGLEASTQAKPRATTTGTPGSSSGAPSAVAPAEIALPADRSDPRPGTFANPSAVGPAGATSSVEIASDPAHAAARDGSLSTTDALIRRPARRATDGTDPEIDAPRMRADLGASLGAGEGTASQGDRDPSRSLNPQALPLEPTTGAGRADTSVDTAPADLGARLRSAAAESIIRTGRDRLLASTHTTLHTRIRVQPAELGALQIDLRRHEDATLHIRLTTAHPHAREALKGEMDELVQTLQRHRIEVTDVQIRHDADFRGGGEGRDGTPRQAPGDRAASESTARERTGAERDDPPPERRFARRRTPRWPAGDSKRLDVEA